MNIQRILIIVGMASLLAFSGCKNEHARNVSSSSSAGDTDVPTTRVLSTIRGDEKPPQVFLGHTAQKASENQSASFDVVFSESRGGVAYAVQKGGKFYVVHNDARGREYDAVGTIVLSPDGRRVAYCALTDGKWRMVVDGREGRAYDVLLTPLFSPDGRHVVYQAKEGAKWYVVADDARSEGTTSSYTTPEFSSDSRLIAYVDAASSNKNMALIITDLKFHKRSVIWSIGDLLFTTNREKTRIAAEQVVGNKFRIIDFSFARPDVVHEGGLYDLIEKLTFSDDGVSVCYCALKGHRRLLVLDKREETLPKGLLPQLPVVRPDKKGVGVLLTWHNRFFLHQSFFHRREKVKKYDEAADLTYSADGRFYAYAAREKTQWFIVVNGKEGPAFDRVVTPMFSPDGKKVVYRARKNGKRFLVVADTAGKVLKQHPSYNEVFQPVFTADGKSVVYGVQDGNKLIREVEDMIGTGAGH